MKIDFDRAKSAANARDRGLSFECAADFEWADAVVIEDVRNLYPEPRFVAVGYLDNRLHVLCFTPREGGIRVISFRRANQRERRANMAKHLPLTDEEGEVRELTQADFSRGHPASRVLPEILG
ncbi:MAG: BrnT family toxin, partial [Gammaproteobacteria bacterium]